eukprot:4384240-Pleurochrysis_carterae.AAC.1
MAAISDLGPEGAGRWVAAEAVVEEESTARRAGMQKTVHLIKVASLADPTTAKRHRGNVRATRQQGRSKYCRPSGRAGTPPALPALST